MKTKFYLLLIFFSFSLNAQNLYKFSNDIDKEINDDKSGNDSFKYQMGATNYSISNYYLKALETWDKLGNEEKKISKEDSIKFAKYKMQNAKDYILEKSKNEKIVILNEAHHKASQRTFATSLLKGLYENGYRYIGIEALFDESINNRKFPTIKSGFYTSEPQFANFIKTALDLGFILFSYEAEQGKNGKEREIGQAENIYKFMQSNINGKYFIYCGYQHAYEGIHENWEKTMAGRLTDLTKINPFTIDQTQFSETGNPIHNKPLTRILNMKNPVVIFDEKNNVFNGNNKELYTDVIVINPITKYIKGRPNWMLNENRKLYKIPKSKISSYPSLVLAYRKGEYEKEGVPADIIELKKETDFGFLILDRGNYQIVVKDKDYKISDKFEKKIK